MLLLLLNCILSLNVLHQSADAFISYRLAIITDRCVLFTSLHLFTQLMQEVSGAVHQFLLSVKFGK